MPQQRVQVRSGGLTLALGSGRGSTDSVAQEDTGWNWIPESTPKTSSRGLKRQVQHFLTAGAVWPGMAASGSRSSPSQVGFKKHPIKISLHHL